MSTIRVNSISNSAAAVNFPSNVTVNNGAVVRVVFNQSATPTNPSNGNLWWDTGSSKIKMYINTVWYIVSTV
jgi:hypothetical protein